jgi:hypothetical protein
VQTSHPGPFSATSGAGTAYPSVAYMCSAAGFCRVRVAQSVVFLSMSFWPLHCLSLELHILITHLISLSASVIGSQSSPNSSGYMLKLTTFRY